MYSQKVARCLAHSFCFSHSFTKRGLKTMQAWQALEFGGIDKLHMNETADIPVVGSSSDILVKVSASSINPLDIRMLEGYGATTFSCVRQLRECSLKKKEFPLVPGRDFSGTAVYVGKGVKNIKCGDEVWGTINPWQNGSHSEYVLVPACYVSKKPCSVSHVEAASFPYAGLTAWSALSTFGELSEKSAPKKRILVIGASGGVGTFSIQLLKAWEAEVTAICATDAVEMLQNLGADNVLDYSGSDFKYNLQKLKGFDLIFDNIGKEYPDLTLDLLKTWKNGKYITVVSPLLKNADERGVLFGTILSGIQAVFDTAISVKDGRSFRWAYFIPNRCALNTISKMVDDKQIIPVVQNVFKFEEMHQAYKTLESGHTRGKIVVDFTKTKTVDK